MKNRLYCFLLVALAGACSKSSTHAASADGATSTETLSLGKSKLLLKDVQYAVAGTNLIVTNRGAAMRTVLVDNDPNKEDHVFSVRLEIVTQGKTQTVEVVSRNALDVQGYRFTADPEGFVWGRSDGAIMVERVP